MIMRLFFVNCRNFDVMKEVKVDASGNNKARFFILSSKVYKEQDNIVGYVRQTGIDAVKYEAWIMDLIQKQGGRITRDNVVKLLNVTPSQAYRLLKKIYNKGRIIQ